MFWEDYYRKHPIDAKRVGDGKEVKFVTGDTLLDKWEDEISRGLTPDLTEGLSSEARAKELAAIKRSETLGIKAAQADELIGAGFEEKYGA